MWIRRMIGVPLDMIHEERMDLTAADISITFRLSNGNDTPCFRSLALNRFTSMQHMC